MADKSPQGRDKAGRFVKGQSGNPGGMKKRPECMYDFAKQAPERLRAIADDPDTPVKVKADIEKWFYEQVHGKAPQAIDLEGRMENTGTMKVEFTGVLSEWSE